MSKHTPGPWLVDIKDLSVVGCPNENQPATIATVEQMPCIGGYDDIAADRGRKMEKANANLIAAAPEMYEALKQIEKCEGSFSRDPLTHAANVLEEHERIAHEVLAKARGES